MSTPSSWVTAYARQARADYAAWGAIQRDARFPECHRLLFLQMACEKLCKAYLIDNGSDPYVVQTSHAYIAGPLPELLRKHLAASKQKLKQVPWVLEHARHLAREIEMLAPAVRRGGQRPDNCEYPWEDDTGVIRSPLDWTFPVSALLESPAGRTFLKLVQAAISRLLS
jgi:hypothetical protein